MSGLKRKLQQMLETIAEAIALEDSLDPLKGSFLDFDLASGEVHVQSCPRLFSYTGAEGGRIMIDFSRIPDTGVRFRHLLTDLYHHRKEEDLGRRVCEAILTRDVEPGDEVQEVLRDVGVAFDYDIVTAWGKFIEEDCFLYNRTNVWTVKIPKV